LTAYQFDSAKLKMAESRQNVNFVTHRKKSSIANISTQMTPEPNMTEVTATVTFEDDKTSTVLNTVTPEPLSIDENVEPQKALSLPLLELTAQEGNVTIPVVDFNRLISSMEGNFQSLRDDIQSLKSMQTQIVEVKDIANEALTLAKENDSGITDLQERVEKLESQLGTASAEALQAKCKLETVTSELASMKQSTSNLENYLRRDNLLFLNVKTSENENCEVLVRGILKKLNLQDADTIKIVRCHRLKSSKSPFPIICRFHFFGDRQRIFQNRFALKGSNIYIEEHFSDEVYSKRLALLPIHKAAQTLKIKSSLRMDKLILDGKTYDLDHIGDVPHPLKSIATCSKSNNEVAAFFGERSPLSNFHKTSFTHREHVYHCTEQFLQYHKALLFKDEVTAHKILTCKSARQAKALSHQVKGVDEQLWQNEAPGIMKKGLELKFSTDEKCKTALLATESRTLAEASADKFWGTGMTLSDPLTLNSGAWKGQNVLGKLLEEVREQLSYF
jgi:ribA/ribD-fused uncharacterized protein